MTLFKKINALEIFIALNISLRNIKYEDYIYLIKDIASTPIICILISHSVKANIANWIYEENALLSGGYQGLFPWFSHINVNNLPTHGYHVDENGLVNGFNTTQLKGS